MCGLKLSIVLSMNVAVRVQFCRYGKREAMAYAASRIQGSYGTVLRVLSEVFNVRYNL